MALHRIVAREYIFITGDQGAKDINEAFEKYIEEKYSPIKDISEHKKQSDIKEKKAGI